MTIQKQWAKLETWLEKNAQEIHQGLNIGATQEELNSFSTKTGLTLTEEFRSFYSIHNGQNEESPWIFDATEFLSLERIFDEWTIWKDLLEGGDFDDTEGFPDQGIKNSWWNKHWIPFTYNGSGDHLCIDLDPTSDGSVGQIIQMWHDEDTRSLEGSSLTEWFTNFVTKVSHDNYVFSDEYGGLINKEDL